MANYSVVNLGMGSGVPIYSANLGKNNTNGIFTFKAPMQYDVKLPYKFTVEQQPYANPNPVEGCNPLVKLTPILAGQPSPIHSWSAHCRVAYGTQFSKSRKQQRSYETLSGNHIVFDTGVTICKGELHLRGLEQSDGDALEHFLANVLGFDFFPFNIEVLV